MNSLPFDLIRNVAILLDYPSFLNLKCTCRRISQAIAPIRKEVLLNTIIAESHRGTGTTIRTCTNCHFTEIYPKALWGIWGHSPKTKYCDICERILCTFCTAGQQMLSPKWYCHPCLIKSGLGSLWGVTIKNDTVTNINK